MIRNYFLLSIPFLFLNSCIQTNDDSHYVNVMTDKGEITIKLYNQTPKHRDNLLKLSKDKFYDGQIFHRVINNFVIQGGDPSTKKAVPDSLYGNNDSGYLIEPEIVDTLIHKRGAVGMAREGDDVNPDKKSSGSQFYIVKGKVFSNLQLDELEKKRDSQNKSKLYKKLILDKIASQKDQSKIDTVSISLDASMMIDSIWESYPKYKFSQKQRQVYTTIGGIPHLDGNYTVFGEVVEGMNIVDEISTFKTDQNDRPIQNIRFSISVLK